jgi:hypothetical protein
VKSSLAALFAKLLQLDLPFNLLFILARVVVRTLTHAALQAQQIILRHISIEPRKNINT